MSVQATLNRRRWVGAWLSAVMLAIAMAMSPQLAPQASALDNDLALTPPMGWNSWNQVRCYDLTEATVRKAADDIVAHGLQKVGYRYVVIDDCWQGGRGADGVLFSDPMRFPSGIAALADYVHERGLLLGLYAVPGSETCANYWDGYPIRGLGSFGHERLDARTFADWGVDYLKYDWCRADVTDGLERQAAFTTMRDALQETGRDIVYAISEYGETQPWLWAPEVANLWRTTHDIAPTWSSIWGIIGSQAGLSSYAGPGSWNDPDMLQVGNGSLSLAENRTHFAMWSMLAAPLFMGTDIGALDPAVIDVVTNPGMTAIDQDRLGAQAERVSSVGGVEVWSRRLADGSTAVAVVNGSSSTANVSTTLAAIGAAATTHVATDVWSGKPVRNITDRIDATVAAHDTQVFRLTPGADPSLPGLINATGQLTLSQGSSARIDLLITNATSSRMTGGVLSLPSAGDVQISPKLRRLGAIPAGKSVKVAVQVSVAPEAQLGQQTVLGEVRFGDRIESASVMVTVVPPAPSADTVVSSLPFLRATAGWGTVTRNLSIDGNPLTVAGTTWHTGIGTHAASEIEVWLGSGCTTLTGAVGIDDETQGGDPHWGTPLIEASIIADGAALWASDGTIGYHDSEQFSLDVSSVDSLLLQVSSAGPDAYDHADWLGMQLSCG